MATVRTGSPDVAYLWLRRGDQVFVGTMLIAAVVLLAGYWGRLSGWGWSTIEVDRPESRRYEYKIDINRATWVEWEQLDGIGETLAHRIVAERETGGPFKRIDDLRRVKGIGPKNLGRIRPWLTIPEATATP